MINLEAKKAVVSEFEGKVKEFYPIVSAKYDVQKAMDESDVDTIKDCVKSVQNSMVGSIPEGLKIPEVITHVFAFGESKVTYFTIKVINKSSSPKKFAFSITVTSEKAFNVVFDFFYGVYLDLIVDELVTENLEKVNDVLQQVVANAGVDYNIKIVSDLGIDSKKKIVSFRDDEVVFVADSDKIFELEDVIVLFDEPVEYAPEKVIQDHFNSMVDELRLAQTTAQLVNMQGGALVAYICGISKRVKPMTIIKSIYSKNVATSGKKNGIAYYLKDNVYAAINFTDGVPEVILSPFDINTFVNVDKDVLADIG